mgnify:CR=1 FL=1
MCLRTMVVSSHALVRSALLAMLDGEAEIEPWEPHAPPDQPGGDPDVVLVESGRLDRVGLEQIRDLKARYACAHVLVLALSGEEGAMREALDAGVSGFLLESASRADLLAAMHIVAHGGLYVGRDLLHSWLNRESSGMIERSPDGDGLTPREVEVLRLIVAGYTNPSIAQRLCISVRTVEFHRRNIREKLDVKGPAELVRYALQHGLMATVAADAAG